MRFKRMFCMGGIWAIFAVFSLLLAGANAWGQVPLAINYTSLSMSCGASQNLSASGGCPPYNDKDCIRSEVKRIPDTIG